MKTYSADVRLTPYAFLLPAVAITTLVVLLPAARTFWMSFTDLILYRPDAQRFVGLGNFVKALSDEVFWISLRQSVLWVSLAVGLQFALGFVTALLLNQSFWWRSVARALIVIPWALPSVIIGLMWTWMLDFNLGVLNDMLLRLGLIAKPVAWLAEPDLAFYCVVVTLVWQGFPFFAVTILAGLQSIPTDQLEAAEIDGATRWQRLCFVILPGLADIIMTALLLRIIWVANSLDIILLMTGGGPGYATHTLPLYAFQKAYSSMEYGYGAALAMILTALLMAIVATYVRRSARGIAA
jgi:multiple sugar transport system permease protein